MSIGKQIKTLRQEKGWSQQDLADASGVCQQMISKLETGRAHQTSDIVKLAFALDVSPLFLEGISKQRDGSAKPVKKAQSQKGQELNQKALQACLDVLINQSEKFLDGGIRRQTAIFAKCYEVATQPKNLALSKTKLESLIKLKQPRFYTYRSVAGRYAYVAALRTLSAIICARRLTIC